MKSVYIVTKSLELYSDVSFISFFSTLQKSRDVSSDELINAFPTDSNLPAYLTLNAAETALRQARKMVIVEDDNEFNQKGLTYRSTATPVVLEVQLHNDVEAKANETMRVISRDMIDTSKPATVINFEKDYKGRMPASLSLSGINAAKQCIIS